MMAFQYHAPASVREAAEALRNNPDARALAGGQTLLAAMKLRLSSPPALVDLRRIGELRGISKKDGTLRIGATTTHAEVARSAEVRSAIPALAALAEGIGDRQVRNMGTIGGSLANNDPAACWPAAVLGLGATVHTSQRDLAADDFFRSMFETALKPGELITAVSFPVPQSAAYVKFPNPASRFALTGVFVSRGKGGVRVAVTGAGSTAFRAKELEAALGRSFSADALRDVRIPEDRLTSDLHASAGYRAHLIGVGAARAVRQAGG